MFPIGFIARNSGEQFFLSIFLLSQDLYFMHLLRDNAINILFLMKSSFLMIAQEIPKLHVKRIKFRQKLRE